MGLRRYSVWISGLVLMTACSGAAQSQNYPSRPIRVILPEVGGVSDLAGRMIAQDLSASLGQQVVIENQGGGNGVIAAQIILKAQSDGYTLLFNGSNMWLLQFFQENLPWDAVRDFSPITLAVGTPTMLVTPVSMPATSVKELIAMAKARPGELNYASGSTGSSAHLAGELFKSMAGVNIARIPFKGTGPAVSAVLGEQVQLMFTVVTAVLPHVKAGKLKGLAVTSIKPTELAPGFPTVSAAGLPGYEVSVLVGFWAPMKTPNAIITRLHGEIVRALTRPDAREKLLGAGAEVIASTPDEFSAFIKSDIAKWGKVIREAGIRGL